MSDILDLPIKRAYNRNSEEEIARRRVLEIKRLERTMRRLFFCRIINNRVVAQYNILEEKWKRLTNY